MTTYIALFNLTDAGIKAAKDSPRRLDVDCGPSRGSRRTRALRPIEASKAAVCYVCNNVDSRHSVAGNE